PPRGITESTITLAPITALPPRTTGNIQPAVTSNAMTSAPKHPSTKSISGIFTIGDISDLTLGRRSGTDGGGGGT
ncbi:unnamed protein product, partial [Didymodactylos carnosus]